MNRKFAALILTLAAIHLVLLFAGFLAPYDPTVQDRDLPYAPPTRLHFRDASGWHLRPFVCALKPGPDGYIEDDSQNFHVRLMRKGTKYKLLGLVPLDGHLFGVDEPGKIALLGTDEFGRDEFSRVLYGGQISVAAGILATLMALAAGAIFGIVAGYYGWIVDETLMGATELFLCLPWLYFLLGVRAFLPLHVSPARTFLLLTGVIGLIGWARPARLVRGIVLSARTRNYVLAAKGFGASDFYLMRRHILPEVMGVLLTQAALLVPRYIAAEVTLSFFGLGVNEPTASWGNMLSVLQRYSVLVSYGWLLAPAVALVITSVIYGLLADALLSRLEFQST
ncbi:MAG TPA: ABC transporter permease [Terriglobales bacterium]|nr:ABC transporter permease [Terriglobales bacterium]